MLIRSGTIVRVVPDTEENRIGEVSNAIPDPLRSVPERQRGLMLSGMRWTLWLSIASAPLSFVTAILLARVGPAVLGTYTVLSLYIAITSVFLFFGGNSVAIKFLPELDPADRGAFLLSYFVVTLVAVVPYQIVGSFWPRGLRYVLGSEVSNRFAILLVWLAPLYILFSIVLAALKGLLEIKWAQIYNRVLTFSNFAVYLSLFLFARGFLERHYAPIIWSLYLTLALLLTVVAGRHLLAQLGRSAIRKSFRFLLPLGFWRYTGSLQANCVLDFLSQRLDCIFILDRGGVVMLGRYTALLTLISVIPTFATFVLDSLLPSLTNTMASQDHQSSRHLTEVYLRFILPCGVVAATFATLFAHPVFGLFGSKYADLVGLGLLAFPFAGIQVMNWFCGTLFTAIGRPHLTIAAKLIRCVVFCTAFFPLWDRYGLLGAVLAWAAGETSDQIVLLGLLIRKMPFRFSAKRVYAAFLGCLCLAAFAARVLGGHRPLTSLGIWILLMAVFFLVGQYSVREMREIAHMVLPSRVSALIS